jgi:hypothetical protein
MHKIDIFNIEGQDRVELTGGCASCSSGCDPVTHSIAETMENFAKNYSQEASIERHELGEANLDEVAEKLQTVYQNSGERLIITGSNIKFILGKLSPVIAIDGKLAANNYVPDADELKFAIDHNGGIYNSICN